MPIPILIAIGCALVAPVANAVCDADRGDERTVDEPDTNYDCCSGFDPSERTEDSGGERQTTLSEFD